MPSNNSLWIVTAPATTNSLEQLEDLETHLAKVAANGTLLTGTGPLGSINRIEFPEFKIGTLSSLLLLSESLTKQDPSFTSTLNKIVETIRSLTSSTPGSSISSPRNSPLSTHLVMDDGRTYLDYLQNGWQWNKAKYRTEIRSLSEVVESLVKEVQAIENVQRLKSSTYAQVKSQLAIASRKKTGNLSVRSMAEVVSAEDFANTANSEYMETVLVAVPKNLTREWETTYERLAGMVVPRSSTKIAADDEFVLFSVTIFRKVRDEFHQKCREQKFVIRDFTYDEQIIEKQKTDLVALEAEEKELWNDLLRLSRINFSECFQVLVHLKVVRAFIESVLRYGLPSNYFACIIQPAPKQGSRLLSELSSQFKTESPSTKKVKKIDKNGEEEVAPLGEYATVLEGEYLDFVLFEVEKIQV